jgi:hypothetical protein
MARTIELRDGRIYIEGVLVIKIERSEAQQNTLLFLKEGNVQAVVTFRDVFLFERMGLSRSRDVSLEKALELVTTHQNNFMKAGGK